jgi:DNA polymerase III delta subunit
MLHIFYGADEFSIHEALEHLKSQVGPKDVLDANVTRSHVSAYSPQHLQALCNTVPFLAERRMVIVDGLQEEQRRTGRFFLVDVHCRLYSCHASIHRPGAD